MTPAEEKFWAEKFNKITSSDTLLVEKLIELSEKFGANSTSIAKDVLDIKQGLIKPIYKEKWFWTSLGVIAVCIVAIFAISQNECAKFEGSIGKYEFGRCTTE